MEFAPLTIQAALALLGFALSRYLWDLDRVVSSVVISFTSFGAALYVAFVAASAISFDCPFQTPLSLLIHYINHGVGLWLCQWQRNKQRTRVDPEDIAKSIFSKFTLAGDLALQVDQLFQSPTWKAGYKLDARCITRMLVLSSDEDTKRIALEFTQDITWYAEIKRTPLKEIHRTLISCFDFTHPQTPTLIPILRDLAYLSAKAYAYIHVQRRCLESQHVGDYWFPDEPHEPLSLRVSGDSDPDLRSALLMVDKALEPNLEVIGDYKSLSPAHRLWMSHLFVYYARRHLLSDDVLAFVRSSLDPEQPPDLEQFPNRVVIADCLSMIGILLDILPGDTDLTRRDKR